MLGYVQRRTRLTVSQGLRLRFLAPQIPGIIYGKYYAGKKIRGLIDREFMRMINGTLVCLTSAIICHTLCAWQTGVYLEPKDFKFETSFGMLRALQGARAGQ